MPYKFKTKRDPAAGLLPQGIYRFVVDSAKEVDKGEFPYAAMQLKVIVNGVKQNGIVYENLSSSPKSEFRVAEFFDSVGIPNEAGEIGAEEFRGKTGWARFIHEQDQDGKLQFKVKRYLTEAQAERAIERQMEENQEEAGAMRMTTQRSSRPAPSSEAKPVRAKTSKAIADNSDDEDIPF